MSLPHLALALLLSPAWAAGLDCETSFAAATVQALSKEAVIAIKAIEKELDGMVTTVKKPFSLFSYAHRGDRDMTREGASLREIQEDIDSFWSSDQFQPKRTMLANGYYAATDPFVSRSFGGKDFLLFKTRVAPGSRYLRVDYEWKNEKIPELLQNAGCLGGPEFTQLNFLLGGRNSECRQIALTILRKLDVDAAYYPWSGAKIDGCKRESMAFLILKNSFFTHEDISVLTKAAEKAGTPGREDQDAIQALWRSGQVGPDDGQKLSQPWPRLTAKKTVDYRGWLKRNILGCD